MPVAFQVGCKQVLMETRAAKDARKRDCKGESFGHWRNIVVIIQVFPTSTTSGQAKKFTAFSLETRSFAEPYGEIKSNQLLMPSPTNATLNTLCTANGFHSLSYLSFSRLRRAVVSCLFDTALLYSQPAANTSLTVLGERGKSLGNFEHGADDVVSTNSIPKLLQAIQSLIDLLLLTALDHSLDFDRVRAVDHAEDIVATDEAKSSESRLQVVDRLPHVSLRTEDKRGNTIIAVLNVLCFANLIYPLHQLSVRKPSGARIDFHSSPQRLLRTRSHAVGLVQYHNLLSASG
ncbi:hypothetical protein KC356_g287 [Hortaea werneckii]|nr:hypothetical protein KC356_g287 [Hortaea werneckii]